MTAPHPSTDEMLRASVRGGDGTTRVVTLDPRFQGLPDTAHGGTILALFDAVASARPNAVRTLVGTYRRRVPLGAPLSLAVTHDRSVTRLQLADGDALLVDGGVLPGGGAVEGADGEAAPAWGLSGSRPAPVLAPPIPQWGPPEEMPTMGSREMMLPVSRTCFACGTENTLGL